MTLLFVDSCQHYTESINKYDYVSGISNTLTTYKRHGTRSLRLYLTGTIRKTFSPSGLNFTVGFACFFSEYYGGQIVEFRNSTDSSGNGHFICLAATNTLILEVKRGPTVLATSPKALKINRWYYVELQVFIDDSNGSYDLRVNEETILSGSNVDTKHSALSTCDQICFSAGYATGFNNCYIQDIYLLDNNGTFNNSFLGDIRVDCLYPNGNGSSSQFIGSDGNSTDNYLLVNEATLNEDTSYVESSTVNDIDLYQMDSMSSSPLDSNSIYGVQAVNVTKKDDAGARDGNIVLRTNTAILSSSFLCAFDCSSIWLLLSLYNTSPFILIFPTSG